ncbi:Oidioi.mRNA.OKI2018_I69.chr2.g4559.t1.cds [Oikopleura dioica]|uniref:Oidioi.mRNA.OKI2018_I69.chr2.g4559.t1.cds n=1 Tax=Oikopleura dioica TaxID=34765 RepID=A0ABN7SXQ0_OIKDI|nr:Oidioi.mRNA.OKI2018_I69.chr2.g4559.t1.cds [Oikopleura dioica]
MQRQRGQATMTFSEAERRKNLREDWIFCGVILFYVILVTVIITSYVSQDRSCDCIGKGCFPEIEERSILQKNFDFKNCSTSLMLTTTDIDISDNQLTTSWLREYITDSTVVDKFEIYC